MFVSVTLSEIRRRIRALERKLAPQLAIINLRRVAEDVVNEWDPADPPEPVAVIRRVADAGFRLSTYGDLHFYLEDVSSEGEVPLARAIVLNLLPWAWDDRYRELFRWDLPAERSRSLTLAGLYW